jgi:hypothetical protein
MSIFCTALLTFRSAVHASAAAGVTGREAKGNRAVLDAHASAISCGPHCRNSPRRGICAMDLDSALAALEADADASF